nr:hypothetical protein [Patescibacteria group bacterium]
WNDGTEQEIFATDELLEKFNINQVQKSPARFDEKRLLWLNGQWIRKLTIEDLYKRLDQFWPPSAQNANNDFKYKVTELVQGRLKVMSDLPGLTNFFFAEPEPDLSLINNDKQLSKISKEDLKQLLDIVILKLQTINDFKSVNIQTALNELLAETNQKPMVLFSLIRIATTWSAFSPDLAPSLHLLGKKKTINRLKSLTNILYQTTIVPQAQTSVQRRTSYRTRYRLIKNSKPSRRNFSRQ